MKRIIMCVWILCSWVVMAAAQVTPKNKTVKPTQMAPKSNTAIKSSYNKKPAKGLPLESGKKYTLTHTGSYKAYEDAATAAAPFRISDPTILALNERATIAADVPVNGSGIIGMPKLAYGVADGQILFRSTGATTYGTSTGSGSVGSGTNPGVMGTGGNVIGVNGKSPYAGPGIYSYPLADDRLGAKPVSAAAVRSDTKKKN